MRNFGRNRTSKAMPKTKEGFKYRNRASYDAMGTLEITNNRHSVYLAIIIIGLISASNKLKYIQLKNDCPQYKQNVGF